MAWIEANLHVSRGVIYRVSSTTPKRRKVHRLSQRAWANRGDLHTTGCAPSRTSAHARRPSSSGMLYVMGGGWTNTTVPQGSTGFPCQCVVMCDTGGDDVGQTVTLLIDAAGPTGQTWEPAAQARFTIPNLTMFVITPPALLPIEPGGGRHVYTFHLEGREDQIALPLQVHLSPPPQ